MLQYVCRLLNNIIGWFCQASKTKCENCGWYEDKDLVAINPNNKQQVCFYCWTNIGNFYSLDDGLSRVQVAKVEKADPEESQIECVNKEIEELTKKRDRLIAEKEGVCNA